MAGHPFQFTQGRVDVAFDGAALTIGDKRYHLDQVTRFGRSIMRSVAQGSWNRLTCAVSLFQPDIGVGSVSFDGDATDPEWGPWRPRWDELDGLLWERVQVPLLSRTLDAVARGELTEIGSSSAKGRGRMVVTTSGIKARKPLAKETPWARIADIDVIAGVYQLHVRGDGDRTKKKLTGLGAMEWDAWQIPLLHRSLSGGA